MAQESSFFNAQLVNGSYDRVYNAENWASYFASFLGNGVSVNPSTGLQVQAGSGMNVIVAMGTAFINGYRYANTLPLGLTINMANATYPRITSIILELNLNDRTILAKAVDGTPSNTPIAPTLTRTTGVYQLQLATILVQAGATQITAGNITDTRADLTVCGFIKGLFGENQSITTAEEVAKIKKEIANLDNTYLTASSEPILSNTWTFGYNQDLLFQNSAGNNMIGFQTQYNGQFTLFNVFTNTSIYSLNPVTSGLDTVQVNANVDFESTVNFEGDIQINGSNMSEYGTLGPFECSSSQATRWEASFAYKTCNFGANKFGTVTLTLKSKNPAADIGNGLVNGTQFQLAGSPLQELATYKLAPFIVYPVGSNPQDVPCTAYLAEISESSFTMWFGSEYGNTSATEWSAEFKALITK